VREALVTDEISIGDYVLSGGEIPALVLIEALVRLIPGVLGDEDSARGDSFYEGILDHPHYTRPAVFEGMEVPPILISGHHGQIRRWRRKEALRRTQKRRPDLLREAALNEEDKALLKEIEREEN
jgi:tRNA (guanine37-N1)-methyltransferase